MDLLQKEAAFLSTQYFKFSISYSDGHEEPPLQVSTKPFQDSLLLSKKQL